MLLALLTSILPATPALLPIPWQADSAPPGMVLVEGGRTKIGTPLKEIEGMLDGQTEAQRFASAIIGETPQHSVQVSDFYLMAYEVTNEQYAAFVQATGSRPPEHWADAETLKEATRAYLEAQALKKKALREAGEPVPGNVPFDRAAWWAKNWSTSDWAIPEGEEHQPVVFVNYQDASAYARWAGVRLPTEFEYQRAVRGSTSNVYVWGNDWDDNKYCSSNRLTKRTGIRPVGDFPAGASKEGAHDLSGNVWEWTASSYVQYKGYKHKDFTLGRGKQKVTVSAVADWDPNQRVIVGGSFQNGPLAARATTRRATDRFQSTDALGFRCAASATPGVDMATTVLSQDLPVSIRPQDQDGTVNYLTAGVVGIDRWETAPFEAEEGKLANYGIVSAYDYLIFIPVERVLATAKKKLDEAALIAPVPFGVLASNQRMVNPDLPAGTYMISYRAAGQTRVPREDKPEGGDDEAAEPVEPEPTLEEILGLDTAQENLIFFDKDGQPVKAIPLPLPVKFKNIAAGSISIANVEKTVMNAANEPIVETVKNARLSLVIPSRVTRKAFHFGLAIEFEPGVLEKTWRKK